MTEREAALTKENEELKERLSHTQRQLDLLVPLCVQQAPEQWREIARDVSERPERLPARLIRQQLVRPVYQYKDEPHRAPVQAPALPNIIEGGSLGVQLMAGLVLDKYLHHQPLYLQAKILEWESGVKLSAATLCQSIGRLADAVAPVVRLMAREMWAGGMVQLDLTPVRCLSREHEGGSFFGQWRPLAGADIDCRQAARRESLP